MNSIENKVLGFLDSSRGYRESPEEVLQILAFLALIKKNQAEKYFDLFKAAPNQQKAIFRTLTEEIDKHEFRDISETKTLDFFPDELLTKAIYLINEIPDSDYSLFARSIRNALQDLGNYKTDNISTCLLATLFSELVGEVSAESIIYDGTAGYANIVSTIQGARLQLEEVNHSVWQLSKILLLLEDREIDFKLTNSLLNSGFKQTNKKADIALMTPPMGLKLSPEERSVLVNEEYIVVKAGKTLPTSAADVLWVQQALANINSKGRVMILLPQGWLFRGGYDAKVRDYLLNNDWVESIISLPAGILKQTALSPAIVILNKNKAATGEIKFIDVSGLGKRERRSITISDDNLQLFSELVQGKHPEHVLYKSVLLPDIIKNEGVLNVSHYIKQESTWIAPDVEQEMIKLGNCMTYFDVAQKKLTKLLSK